MIVIRIQVFQRQTIIEFSGSPHMLHTKSQVGNRIRVGMFAQQSKQKS